MDGKEIIGLGVDLISKLPLERLWQSKKTSLPKNLKPSVNPKPAIPEPAVVEPSTEEKGTACIPCSNSHLLVCRGLLNEAVRFAREDISNPEVSTRIDKCLSEIVAMERVDLAPENIIKLAETERELADYIAKEARDIRHGLEWFQSAQDLENVVAKVAGLQHKTSREWLKQRLSKSSKEDKEKVKQAAQRILEKEIEGG